MSISGSRCSRRRMPAKRARRLQRSRPRYRRRIGKRSSRLTWNLLYPDAENALITHLGHFGLSRADIAKLTAETLGASDKNLRFRDANQAKAVVLHYSLVSKSPTEKETRVRRTLSDAAFSDYP